MNEVIICHEKIVFEDIGSGIPILFIHPPGMGRKVFYEQKPLSKYFRLILPDLVGQGDSTYNGQSKVTMARFAKDIISLMDHLNLASVVLFGYSAGGNIAQYLCIHYPSRFLALIMSGGYPAVDNLILKNEHKLGIFAVEKGKKIISSVIAFSHTKDKAFRKTLKEHMYKSDSRVWSNYYEKTLSFNCKDEIKRTELPVLLLYGSKADAMNTHIKFYKKNLSKLQLFIIKGATHQLPTKESEKVNQIITGYLLTTLKT